MEFCLLQIISFHVPYIREKKIIKWLRKSCFFILILLTKLYYMIYSIVIKIILYELTILHKQ